VACRTSREKRDLLRVVRTPSGDVVIDATGRLNGRGAYVDRDPACVELALSRGLLDRALEVSIPAEVRESLRAAVGPATIGAPSGQE
jgi:predicted RNA-binding protein YlxR (DUF448 family)